MIFLLSECTIFFHYYLKIAHFVICHVFLGFFFKMNLIGKFYDLEIIFPENLFKKRGNKQLVQKYNVFNSHLKIIY